MKSLTNVVLAKTALDCLEELENRGNSNLSKARQDVLFFYEDLLMLREMAAALESTSEQEERLEELLENQDATKSKCN